MLIPETALPDPLHSPADATRIAEHAALAQQAALYATRSRGDGTRRAYRSAWRHYEAWCSALGRAPLPAELDTIAMYVVRRAKDGLAVSSLRVALAAIRTAHLLAGLPLDLRHPRLAMVIDGVVRSTGVRPRRQAAPATPDIMRLMLAQSSAADTPLGARDRAMLLLGFGAALRRSELAALTIGDVREVAGRGLRVLVRRSKTDQHGKGQEVAIWANPREPDFCPATALTRWMLYRRAAADFSRLDDREHGAEFSDERPLFCALTKSGRLTGAPLSDKAVVRLIKAAAQSAGLDPALYSGHSLRAGLATAAAEAGAGLPELMRQTRHRSTEVALGYLRPADLWRANVTEKVFRPDVLFPGER